MFTHPSTNPAQPCLTSELVCRKWSRKNVQVAMMSDGVISHFFIFLPFILNLFIRDFCFVLLFHSQTCRFRRDQEVHIVRLFSASCRTIFHPDFLQRLRQHKKCKTSCCLGMLHSARQVASETLPSVTAP